MRLSEGDRMNWKEAKVVRHHDDLPREVLR